jgi:hypothetical protein
MCWFAHIQPLSNNVNVSLPIGSHRNAVVRAATARLFTMIVNKSGADILLGPSAGKVFRHQILSATAKFLQDKNEDTRYCVCFNFSQAAAL